MIQPFPLIYRWLYRVSDAKFHESWPNAPTQCNLTKSPLAQQ
jgi:hypothetical protein